MWVTEDPITDVTAGVLTLATIANAADFSNRQVQIAFATARVDGRYEFDDEILIQVAYDGGIPPDGAKGTPGSGSYTTVGRIVAGDDMGGFTGFNLEQDTDNDGDATPEVGPTVNTTLSTYIFPIPDGGGTNMSIRILADIDGGSEEIAFDNIRVTGDLATSEIPVLSGIEGTATTFTEGGSPVQVSNSLQISDADSSQLTGATVSITSNFDSSEDTLIFINQLGITGSYNSGNGVLTLSGTTSLINYRTALRSVTYDNTDNDDAIMATRTISFKVTDDLANISLPATRDVDVNVALNAATPLPLAGYCESFETNGEGTRYGSNHAVVGGSDFFERFAVGSVPAGYVGAVSGPGLEGSFAWASEDTFGTTGGTGMVTLAPLTVSGFTNLNVSFALEQGRTGDPDQWESDDSVKVLYSMDGAPFEVVGAFYGDNSNAGQNGVLREDTNLNGASSDADGGLEVPANLTNYTFPIPVSGTTLVVRVEVRSNGSEEIAFDNICVNGSTTSNSPPALAAIEGSTIAYAEGAPAVGLTNTITVSDTDDTDLESASLKFTSAFSQTQDELLFTNQNGISGSYNAVAGELTLTGTSSLENYQTALRSVQFINNDVSDAAPGTRTVRFAVNDGDSGSNIDQTRDIAVSTTINPPIALASSGYCESFETNGAGTRYASNHASDGTDDVFERFQVGTLPSGWPAGLSGDIDGTWLWFAEDSLGTTGGEATIDLQTQIVTGWDDLSVSIALGNGRNGQDRFEHDDYVRIVYSMDGGPFTTIGAFYGNDPADAGRLVQDQDLDGSSSDGDGGAEVPTPLTTYNFPIPATGTNLVVGVRVSSNGSEEVAFDNICITGTDVEAPLADLAGPLNGASIGSAAINTQAYLDVTFSDNVELDLASITDAGGEVFLSGAGAGTAVPSGTPVLQSGTTYRYSFTGSMVPGLVTVIFPAASFEDHGGLGNVSENESFTVTNTPPIADTNTVERHPTSSLKIPLTTLLAGDTDPDGNTPLSVTAVTPSGSGATVTLSGTRVLYNPNGLLTADTFTYTLQDSLGATSTGTVNVNLITDPDPGNAGPNLVSLVANGDGSVDVVFAGIPGRSYQIQTSETLLPGSWVTRATVVADPQGKLPYHDSPPLPPTRFYRTLQP